MSQPAESTRATTARARRRWIVPLLALLILVAGFLGARWYLLVRSNWGVVVPGKIYRSAKLSRFMVRGQLADNHIGTIVFLSRDIDGDPDLRAERQAAKDLGIDFLNFPMNGDGVAEPSEYPAALAAIWRANAAGRPVLVHCHAGAQRTGGVIAMYRLLVEGKSPSEVEAEMFRYGFDPRKNDTLLPFLNQHVGQWADALVQMGVIPRAPNPLPRLAS